MNERDVPPLGFCQCGCGRKTRIAERTDKRHGHVRGEPIRFINRHARRSSPVDYVVNPDTGCWEWQLRKNRQGYGLVTREGRARSAYKWMYEQVVGPVPDGLHLDHLCCNVGCVNPAHLEPVTAQENVRRSRVAKLTVEEVGAIRQDERQAKELAAEYGVSTSLVSMIRNRHVWKDVT